MYFNIPCAGLTLSWNVHPKLCGRGEPEHVTSRGNDEWATFKQLLLVPLTTQMKLSHERMSNDVSSFLKMISEL